jgi:DNA-directed RNA polymerase specialized sigma24 family protein
MAWDSVQFRDRHGNLVAEKTRNTLLQLIEKALASPDADPDSLINAASGVCANIGTIRNFAAYANRSIFRVARRGYVAEKKAEARLQPLPNDGRSLEDAKASSDAVERQILLEELMSGLSPIDRQIYTLRLNGKSFIDIDEALSLKPRTSEYRFREAQSRLRKNLSALPSR